jgi:hypothetical protein
MRIVIQGMLSEIGRSMTGAEGWSEVVIDLKNQISLENQTSLDIPIRDEQARELAKHLYKEVRLIIETADEKETE